MNLADKIVRKIQRVEGLRGEAEIIEKILLKEAYRDEEHEDQLRMDRIVKQGQASVVIRELEKDFKRFVKQ